MFLTLIKSLKSDFIREVAIFRRGVVVGKMNSEAVGQKVKDFSKGTLNSIFHGFCSN